MNRVLCIILMGLMIGLVACQKDYSLETPQAEIITPTPTVALAKGTLKDVMGNCQSIGVNGSYIKGIALKSSNSISVMVNFTTAGKYKIYTDTVNGCWFSMDTAITNSTGAQTITLQGFGKPTLADTANFNVFFLNTSCPFSLVTDTLSSDTDYLPISVGTYWTYDTVLNARVKDTVRYTVVNQPQTINGQTYSLAISTNKDTEFYRKNYQGQYYRYFNQFSPYGLVFEYKIVDEALPVGVTWRTGNYTISVPSFGTVTSYLECQIIAKNLTMTVAGNTFKNVIHVQETLYIPPTNVGSPYAPFGSFDAYYAIGVGLVEYLLPGVPNPISLYLRRWHVQ